MGYLRDLDNTVVGEDMMRYIKLVSFEEVITLIRPLRENVYHE